MAHPHACLALIKPILWAFGMNMLNECVRIIHPRRFKRCLLTLLICPASLYLFHYIYKPHIIIRHWLNVCTQPSNCKIGWYQNEIIPIFQVAFEPISVENHVEWHVVFNHQTQHLRLTRSQWTVFIGLILRQFNVTDYQLMQNTSAPDVLSTCVETLAKHQRFPLPRMRVSLLEQIVSVGGMPPKVIYSPNLMKTFDQNNPVDEFPEIYLDPIILRVLPNIPQR
ncbi:unnamed protein product [Calicophoron daubneyi]|uniref:Uncharacterized protein n=1 Tax=Calicophoron daubneyi TaxID=300641 RepID=A0AAV2SX01_CALDB